MYMMATWLMTAHCELSGSFLRSERLPGVAYCWPAGNSWWTGLPSLQLNAWVTGCLLAAEPQRRLCCCSMLLIFCSSDSKGC